MTENDLKNKALRLFNNMESLESLELALYLIHLTYNDILYNAEAEKDKQTTEKILEIILELNKIIKKYER